MLIQKCSFSMRLGPVVHTAHWIIVKICKNKVLRRILYQWSCKKVIICSWDKKWSVYSLIDDCKNECTFGILII